MLHGLPPKPGTSFPAALPPTTSFVPAVPDESSIAGPSRAPTLPIQPSQTTQTTSFSPTATECVICSKSAKYTCPRCSCRSCSLGCSKTHKEKYQCDGQRDPTKFVPLARVGQGAWADDYRWLEEGRRKVAEWGDAIPKSSLIELESASQRGGSRGRGSRGGRDRRRGGGDRGKSLGLEKQLEMRGIKVGFMPDGMDRRKRNQSSWNPRTQKLYITVQFSLDASMTVNDMEKISKSLLHNRVCLADPTVKKLPTLRSLIPEEILNQDIVLVLPYHQPHTHQSYSSAPLVDQENDSRKGGVQYFPPLSLELQVGTALRGTSFVEFPTITMFARAEWDAQLARGQVRIMPSLDTTENRKRKWAEDAAPAAEVELKAPASGTKAEEKKDIPQVSGLSLGLGDYRSDDEE